MTIDILYVTYSKDLPWFEQSLKVLRRNLSGYRDIHVVCPIQDREAVELLVGDDGTVHAIADWPGNGYQWQQWVKLQADAITDAEYIAHIDSDVFIAERTDLSEFFIGDKPAWMWAWYSDLGQDVPWQKATQNALGEHAPREFMQAFPFIIHRDTYPAARKAIEDAHVPRSSSDYIYSLKGNGVFSEFNVMGHVAYRDQKDLYHWIDRNRDEAGVVGTSHWPPAVYKVPHFWSHSKVEDQMRAIRKMLGENLPPGLRYTNRGWCVIDGDTHISTWVEKHGKLDHDGYLLPKILEYIKPGDVVVDVGAFIGDHTHAYAKATAGVDSGRVLAFEPNPLPYEALVRNMQGHGHVLCVNGGLADKPGTMSLVQSENTGATYGVSGDRVELKTLDSYELHQCNLIKIDAEGYELHILHGAKETIKRCKPVLVLEVNPGALARQGVTVQELHEALYLLDYHVQHVLGDDVQADIICLP